MVGLLGLFAYWSWAHVITSQLAGAALANYQHLWRFVRLCTGL
jgi:hypothetical protein